MREQFYIVPYNHFIKKLISATFHYPKVKNTTFDELFRCIRYYGFHCIPYIFETQCTSRPFIIQTMNSFSSKKD